MFLCNAGIGYNVQSFLWTRVHFKKILTDAYKAPIKQLPVQTQQ